MKTERHNTGTKRKLLRLVLLVVLLSTTLVTSASAQAESSPAPTASSGATDLPVREVQLDGDRRATVATSVAEDRVVLRASDYVEIYILSSLEKVASHHFVGGTSASTISGGNVYVALYGSEEIVEIRLQDGVVLQRWETGPDVLRYLNISQNFVWFYRFQTFDSDVQSVCRLALAHGGIECFDEVEAQPFHQVTKLVQVDPSEESFVLQTRVSEVGQTHGNWFVRYHLVGNQAVRDMSGPSSPEGYELEPAPESDYTLWHLGNLTMENAATSTLHPSSVRYNVYGVNTLIVEPQAGELAAVRGGQLEVLFYRRGTADPVASLRADGSRARSVMGSALTTTELVQIEQSPANDYWLRVYAIPADSEPASADPGVNFDEGSGGKGVSGAEINTVHSLEIDEASNRLVVAGANVLGLYELDTMRHVANIASATSTGQHADVSIQGTSVFVLDQRLGQISDYALADGSLRNRWTLPARGALAVAASPSYVWFSVPDLETPSIGKIDRRTGTIELIELSSTPGGFDHLYVNPSNQNELLGQVGGQSARIVVSGQAVVSLDAPHGRPIGQAWGSGGDVVYAATQQQVIVTNSAGEQAVIETLPHQYFAHFAADSTGDHLALTKSQGVIRVYDAGSIEPRYSFATEMRAQQLAISENYVAAVSGHDSNMTITVWPEDLERPDNVIEFISLVHGETTLQSLDFFFGCGAERSLVLEMAATRRLALDASERYCVVEFPRHRDLEISIWTNNEWVKSDAERVWVDMLTQPRILFALHYPTPANSRRLFVSQTYLDIAGEVGSRSDISEATIRLARDEISKFEFIAALMQDEGAYETLQAPVSRLYRAYFLRNADLAGHQFWVDQRRGGRSLYSVSDFFADSPEFKTRYGSVDDAEFVRLVYKSVMVRLPDAEGEAYWMERLRQGLSRGEMMALFSDSPEFRTRADADVFVTYIAGALEQRELTPSQHREYVALYITGGQQAVVDAVLNGDAYYDRFWATS